MDERGQHTALNQLAAAGHSVHLHELVTLVLVSGSRAGCAGSDRLRDMLITLCNVGLVPSAQVCAARRCWPALHAPAMMWGGGRRRAL